MTTLREANNALAAKFASAWNAIEGNLPYQLENGEFEEPEGPWARFSTRIYASAQETLGSPGNRKFTREGAAHVQIFTPVGEGTNRAKELTQCVVDKFEGARTVSGVCYGDVIPREEGVDGKWYMTSIEIAFRFTEIK